MTERFSAVETHVRVLGHLGEALVSNTGTHAVKPQLLVRVTGRDEGGSSDLRRESNRREAGTVSGCE